jgi:hypothetical protein
MALLIYMESEKTFQNNEQEIQMDEALAAISAVNAELSGIQAGDEVFNELRLFKERLENGESPKIIIAEVEKMRDLVLESRDSKDSLDKAA